VETISAWIAWGGAQPLFLQIFLGLLLFLAAYTIASVALFALVLGAAWLLRSIGRAPHGFVGTDRPMPAADSALTSWIVHAAGATLIVWLVVQALIH
jgi:hypothetical protein